MVMFTGALLLALVQPSAVHSEDVKLHVHSRVHFNTNVRDFTSAREFYGKLGFETLTGFPDTNTQAMARAIGIDVPTAYDGAQGGEAGGYLLHGELIGINGARGGLIDLIEFSIPRNEAPPYARLNHLGMTHAAMYTTDITADYEYLQTQGVRFVSAPVAVADGSVFAFFTDPDGTYYQLLQPATPIGEADEEQDTHIVGLGHVNVNVSDLERSLAWYRMLGYEVSEELAPMESLQVARAMGFESPVVTKGVMLVHPEDDSRLQLMQWITPHDPERAYEVPVNHIGIHRMAFATTDIEEDVAALRGQGVEFLSPITPCCSGPDSWGRIVAFYDPDGVVVELVEQPLVMDWLMRFMRWLSS